MSIKDIPAWDEILSAAARLQVLLLDAVLVEGTAASIHAGHRRSLDADHVLTGLKSRFDEVLGQLESVAGWKTARLKRPVQILGNLDGIDTGVRQLIRSEPLETLQIEHRGQQLTVPTRAEMLRIKAVLILRRNATRDYLDFVALADSLGEDGMIAALRRFDPLYPQANGSSALQQLQIQLADPRPFDLEQIRLAEYRQLDVRWQDWGEVRRVCASCATSLLARDDEMER